MANIMININDANKESTINCLWWRALWHHIVAGLTLFSACIVAIAAAGATIYFVPWYVIPKLKEIMVNEKGELIILVMNGPVAFTLAAISYLAHLLVSAYRYNMSLYGHYRACADVLKLISFDMQMDLETLNKFINPSVIKFDNPPLWQNKIS